MLFCLMSQGTKRDNQGKVWGIAQGWGGLRVTGPSLTAAVLRTQTAA